METPTPRTPCPRCGRYHVQSSTPVPYALSESERAQLDLDVQAALRRQLSAPDMPDLNARLRAARGGAR